MTSRATMGLIMPKNTSTTDCRKNSRLKLKQGSKEWGQFFDLSVHDIDRLPADIADGKHIRDLLPMMLRTIANSKLTREEIIRLIKKKV